LRAWDKYKPSRIDCQRFSRPALQLVSFFYC
jgi:hypothetical protein